MGRNRQTGLPITTKKGATYGRRINVYLPKHQLKIHDEIENFSNFVQICLLVASDVMAWAILKDIDPKKFNTGVKRTDVIDKFNKRYPLDPLTKRRLHGPGNVPQNAPDYQEQNPILR